MTTRQREYEECDICGKSYTIDEDEIMRPGICEECFDKEVELLYGSFELPKNYKPEGR